MLSFNFLAGTGLTLLCACAGAAAQDTQPEPHVAPHAPRLRLIHPQSGGMVLSGPRAREDGQRLGVSVEQTPDGLKVTKVDDGSLAASAGVKADDVLMRIGDRRVHEVDDVALALHGHDAGSEVELTVIRPGEGLVTLHGTLPEVAEPQKASPPDGMKGGFLGVQMKDDQDRGDCGGVAVAGVVPDSAAWFAGLEEGDCLLSIDGKSVTAAAEVAGAVAAREPGSLVELRYSRKGEEVSTKVRLGHRGGLGMLGGFGAPGGMQSGPNAFRLHRLGEDGEPFSFDMDLPDGMFQLNDGDLDLPDFGHLFDLNGIDNGIDLHGNGSQSVEVRIEDDHMTVTKDGVTQQYERDADGNWIKQGADSTAPQASEDDC